MRRVIICLSILGVAACGGDQDADRIQSQESTTSLTGSAATTTESIGAASSTSAVSPSSEARPMPGRPALASIFPPGRGVSAPIAGWIVTESPYVMEMAFWGMPFPDSVTLDGVSLHTDDAAGQVFMSPPIDLKPGINQLHLVVEYGGQIVQNDLIPVTFLDGAEELLASITAATDDMITVDITEWDDDQEFPGPEDPDPGVLTTLPVADEVRVIVDDAAEVDYEWFEAEVTSGYTNHRDLPGFDDWNPGGGCPYTLTIHNGHVVQIWKVPLG